MLLELPKWRRSGGRDFVFYHPHPGFVWGSESETTDFLGTLCGALQWATMLVAENGQRWQCASFNPRRAPLTQPPEPSNHITLAYMLHLPKLEGTCGMSYGLGCCLS